MTLEVTTLYENGKLKEFTYIVPSGDDTGSNFRLEVDFHESGRKEVRVNAESFSTDSLDFLLNALLTFNNTTERKII